MKLEIGVKKMGKLATPDWIKEGYDSPQEYAKAHGKTIKKKSVVEKVFKIRLCPKCGSDKVNVVLSGNDSGDIEDEDSISKGKEVGEWECKKCNWHGKNIEEKEVTEEEFMEYLDKRGEEVS